MLNNQGLKKLHHAIQAGNEAMARETIDVIAYSINDHEDFRKLLATVEPEKRQVAYETLRSRLPFKPKTLAEYISMNADYAERHQLPTVDGETGALTEFKIGEIGLKQAAENALYDGGIAVLTCRRCTLEEVFRADTPTGARIKAVQQGWKFETELDKWLCSGCNDLAMGAWYGAISRLT